MIYANIDAKEFIKVLRNAVKYSVGFTEGVQKGKRVFLNTLGLELKELIGEFIDSNARVNPAKLHHVYEWYETGSPDARLFDIYYTVSNLGLSIRSAFTQSMSIKDGSYEPFFDKAKIMEFGIPVTIKPVRVKVLKFQDQNGEDVFTPGPVNVKNPGGLAAVGGFADTLNTFFNRYFSQAFLKSSGLANYLEHPFLYAKNFAAGTRSGYGVGVSTGYRWIINAGGIG